MEQLMDENDVAELLNLSPRTIQRWRVEGAGPPFLKMGVGPGRPGSKGSGSVRYSPSDLESWLERQRRESTSDTGD